MFVRINCILVVQCATRTLLESSCFVRSAHQKSRRTEWSSGSSMTSNLLYLEEGGATEYPQGISGKEVKHRKRAQNTHNKGEKQTEKEQDQMVPIMVNKTNAL